MWFRKTVNGAEMDYGECSMPKSSHLVPDKPGVLGLPLLWDNPEDSDDYARFVTPESFGCSRFAERQTCEGCGEEFGAANGKQRYCTPACASNNRWRRWKNRQAVK